MHEELGYQHATRQGCREGSIRRGPRQGAFASTVTCSSNKEHGGDGDGATAAGSGLSGGTGGESETTKPTDEISSDGNPTAEEVQEVVDMIRALSILIRIGMFKSNKSRGTVCHIFWSRFRPSVWQFWRWKSAFLKTLDPHHTLAQVLPLPMQGKKRAEEEGENAANKSEELFVTFFEASSGLVCGSSDGEKLHF